MDHAVGQLEVAEGVERIELLIEIADYYNLVNDHHKGLEYLERAKLLLDRSPNPSLRARLQFLFASAHMHLGDRLTALRYAEKARIEAVEIEDYEIHSESLRILGNLMVWLRDFTKGLDYYNRAYEEAEKSQNQRLKAAVLNNLAVCYWRMEDWERAEDYLRQARENAESNPVYHKIFSNNIGVALMEQGKYDRAETLFKDSLVFFERENVEYSKSLTLSNLADLEQRRGNPEKALEYGHRAQEIASPIEAKLSLIRNHRHMANALMQLGRIEEAEEHMNLSLNRAIAADNTVEQIETYRSLIELLKQKGDFESALEYHIQRDELEKEIYSNRVRSYSILFNIRFDTETQKKEIDLLNKQKELARLEADRERLRAAQSEQELLVVEREKYYRLLQRNIVIAALVLALLAIAYFYRRYRTERHLRAKLLEQQTEIHNARKRLERLNDELNELVREKDEILGIVAHDLKNPLNSQLGIAQILQEDWSEFSKTEIVEMLQSVIVSVLQMQDIIENLLDANRIEGGKIEPNLETLDPSPILDEVIENQRYRLRDKSQTIVSLYREVSVSMEIDKVLFRGVIENLISNAIKYSPHHSTIRVSFRSGSPGEVYCCVEDEGPGISEEEQQRLFQKYARLTAKPTAGESSVGLGLSIVKRMIELMGGEVGCESELGKGSRFWVRLKGTLET